MAGSTVRDQQIMDFISSPHKIVKRDTIQCEQEEEFCLGNAADFNTCLERGMCYIYVVAAPLIWLSVLFNVVTFIHLVKNSDGSGANLLMKFACVISAIYCLLLPMRMMPGHRDTPFYALERFRDLPEYMEPMYSVLVILVDILHQYSYLLLCKDRFTKLWRPEKRAVLAKRRLAAIDISLLTSLATIYVLPLLFIYGTVQWTCDLCWGHMVPMRDSIEEGMVINGYNHVYDFFYGKCLPVIIRVFFPCAMIFLMNVVINPKDTEAESSEVFDKDLGRMIQWTCNIHLVFTILDLYKYVGENIKNEFGYWGMLRFRAVRHALAGLGADTLPVVYLSFQLYKYFKNRRSKLGPANYSMNLSTAHLNDQSFRNDRL